jgi:Trk-type K+ transport system membrane component
MSSDYISNLWHFTKIVVLGVIVVILVGLAALYVAPSLFSSTNLPLPQDMGIDQ